MRIKRMISTLMTVVLLFGCLCFAGTAQAAEETTPVPKVVVSAVNVTKNGEPDGAPTGFLEVSLLVQAKAFQTVGVVLSYDTTVLTPVDWDSTSANPLSPTDSWTTVIPTKGADAAAGKPALAKLAEPEAEGAPVTRAYLYLGASSLQYQDLSAAATRLVTVRFKIAAAGAGYKPVNVPGAGNTLTDEANFTICLAPEAVANDAIPGAQAMLTLGEETSGSDPSDLNVLDGYALKYYTWRSTIADYAEKGETACEVSFELAPGPSINTGSAPVVGGGGNAITFFDWDGRAIDAIAVAPETAKALVEQWENDHAARLTNKPGYEFDRWLVVQENNDGKGLVTEKGTFTSNDVKLDPDTDANVKADVADLDHLFDGGKTSVFLQAAYYARTSPDFSDNLVNGGGSSNADRYYTISDPVFTRYGAADAVAGSYSLTMTVTRKQENGTTGVTRLREPAIWVAMTPAEGNNSANIMNLIRLENTDETTFEIVTTKQIKSVSYKVIDVYGVSNWPGCADRSDATKGVRDRNTCITRGTQGYLAEQAYNVSQGGSWEATVNNWAFADCFYNNGATTGKANATWWTDARCNAAKTALLNATNSKGDKLTYAEVLAAVNGVT